MYSIKKPATTYTAPGQRKADPLAPENFPAFGAAAPTPKQPSLNFLQRVKETEEEREAARRREAAIDRTKLCNMSHAQLRSAGWEVYDLRLVGSTEWLHNWHQLAGNESTEIVLPAGTLALPARPHDEDEPVVAEDDLSSVCSSEPAPEEAV